MKKQIALYALVAVAMVAAPGVVRAQGTATTAANTNAPAKPKKARTSLTANGKVKNVDTNAMTLTVGKRTYAISSETRITKSGNPATLGDIVVDDKVGIAYKKDGDKFDALTINDGKKTENTDAKTSPPGQKK